MSIWIGMQVAADQRTAVALHLDRWAHHAANEISRNEAQDCHNRHGIARSQPSPVHGVIIWIVEHVISLAYRKCGLRQRMVWMNITKGTYTALARGIRT
jgi:hypothetical protein